MRRPLLLATDHPDDDRSSRVSVLEYENHWLSDVGCVQVYRRSRLERSGSRLIAVRHEWNTTVSLDADQLSVNHYSSRDGAVTPAPSHQRPEFLSWFRRILCI